MTTALALLAGCYSIEVAPLSGKDGRSLQLGSSDGVPLEHIVVANSGWFLFNCLPLACGNVNQSAWFPWRLFRNDVHEDILHRQIVDYAQKRQCDIEEMNIFNDNQVLLSIPGTSFPLPIPYVITFRELQISGALVKRGGSK